MWKHSIFFDNKTLRYFKNGPTSASFSFIFGLFNQTLIQFLQQINVEKYPSSIGRRDSNPRPYDMSSVAILVSEILDLVSPKDFGMT